MLQYRLEVEVQRPVLRIRTQPAKIEVQQQTMQFRQNHRPAQMRVHKVKPTFQVDRSQINKVINRQSVFQLSQQFASESLQKGLEAIGRIASEGDRLKMIHQKHQTVANVIAERLAKTSDLNMVAIPRPDLSWDPGNFEIEWTPFEQELIWDMPEPVNVQVQPHQVIIELEQLPDVKFRFVYVEKKDIPVKKKQAPDLTLGIKKAANSRAGN